MENKEKKEKITEEPIEEPVEKITEEKPDEPFVDRERKEQMSIKNLWVGTIKDIISKAVYALLTETQKDDLTDGGATTLHKHDHGEMDGLNDNDHGAIYYTETEVNALVAARLANVVEDTSPQLGGDLDMNNHNIDFPTTANIADCKDEDDMASDVVNALCTQQSIKAYVDDNAGAKYTAGALLLSSADTERSKADDDSYTKVKEIVIDRGGTLRIKHYNTHINSHPGYTRVYRNGVGVGTAQVSSTNYPAWSVLISEDIAGWTAGDLCQLYYKSSSTANSAIYTKEFRIYAAEVIKVNTD